MRAVRRRSSNLKAIEQGANVTRRMTKVSGELHFLVSDACDLRESALEILLHVVSHGVKLNSNAIDFSRPPCPTHCFRRAAKSYACCACTQHFDECTPVDRSHGSARILMLRYST